MISILGTVGEMERNQIRESQLEGIMIAKLKGVYKGRTDGSNEDVLKFLSKPRNRQALEFLKEGKKAVDISQWTGLHINTITKLRNSDYSL